MTGAIIRRMEFLEWLGQRGGVCTVQAARDRLSLVQLHRLRASGAVWTPLRGWIALDGVRSPVTRALQLGGVATCATALSAHGLWTPHGETRTHVRVNRETHSDRVDLAERTPGVVVHRMHGWFRDIRPVHGLDPILAALAVASGCLAVEDVVAAAEAGLRAGVVTRDELTTLAAALPRRRRRALGWFSPLSGSGLESAFAVALRRARIGFVQQFEPVPGMFVDFLIGTSLIVELDSRTWHGKPVDIETDRRRDAILTGRGYRVVRFTYEQVLFQREWVLEQLLVLVRRDAHRRRTWA